VTGSPGWTIAARRSGRPHQVADAGAMICTERRWRLAPLRSSVHVMSTWSRGHKRAFVDRQKPNPGAIARTAPPLRVMCSTPSDQLTRGLSPSHSAAGQGLRAAAGRCLSSLRSQNFGHSPRRQRDSLQDVRLRRYGGCARRRMVYPGAWRFAGPGLSGGCVAYRARTSGIAWTAGCRRVPSSSGSTAQVRARPWTR